MRCLCHDLVTLFGITDNPEVGANTDWYGRDCGSNRIQDSGNVF
jgi:hypothetical protein